jgi:hypothetical protein
MADSSRSAVPISSRRLDGLMTLLGSSGRSEKRTMFQVSLVMGFTRSASSERYTSAAVMIGDQDR